MLITTDAKYIKTLPHDYHLSHGYPKGGSTG